MAKAGATVVIALFVGACDAGEAREQAPLFVRAPASPLEVGRGSGEVVLADLNRDGHLDLLTKHLLQRRLAVRLGDGKGRFAPALPPTTFDYEPGAIAVGDVDADSVLDLVVASRDAAGEHVRVFRGDGSGGFPAPPRTTVTVSAATEYYKPSLHLGDVNEDGKVDVVAANGRRSRVEILLGDGRGGLALGPVVQLEGPGDRHSFALGDVDGDGHLDLVTVGGKQEDPGPARLAIRRGDGKGAFADASGSFTVPGPRLGTLADLDGDRRLDAVLAHVDSRLSVLSNGGADAFAPAPRSPYDVDSPSFAVVAADVDRDGRSDLVAATVRSVTVLLGSDRGFAPAPGSPFPAGPGAYQVAVGDVDEDGKLDVAASSFEGDAVTLLLGR